MSERFPTFVAARDRAVTWWDALSTRERRLVGVLGALILLAVLVWGVVRPLQASRTASLAQIRTYETLVARVRAAGTLGAPAGPAPRTGSAVEMLTAAAGAAGLTPQLDAVEGATRATLADADHAAVIAFIADVQRTTPLTATAVDLRRLAVPGRVAATIVYRAP